MTAKGREKLTACKKMGLWEWFREMTLSWFEIRQMHRFLPQFALHYEAVLMQIALPYWASTMSPLLMHYFWPSKYNLSCSFYMKRKRCSERENKCKATQLIRSSQNSEAPLSYSEGSCPTPFDKNSCGRDKTERQVLVMICYKFIVRQPLSPRDDDRHS